MLTLILVTKKQLWRIEHEYFKQELERRFQRSRYFWSFG